MSPSPLPLRTLPRRGLEFASYRISRFGERSSIDWLTYNPLQLHAYHRLATVDAAAVIGAMIEVFPDAQRFADVGAGSGAFAAEVARRGRHIEACEHAFSGRVYARLQKVSSTRFDLRDDPPAQLAGPFDLAYCFEVAEHLPPELGDRLVAFLARTAPAIVFTAAPPGQGGLGHINEQEPAYWIDRFAPYDQERSEELTAHLRESFSRHRVSGPWFMENLIVLRAKDHP